MESVTVGPAALLAAGAADATRETTREVGVEEAALCRDTIFACDDAAAAEDRGAAEEAADDGACDKTEAAKEAAGRAGFAPQPASSAAKSTKQSIATERNK